MARSITLTRKGLLNEWQLYFSAFRIRVEAVATGMDNRIFLFKRGPYDQYNDIEPEIFVGVASPADMTEYPPDAPQTAATLQYYRKGWFELDLRTSELAETVWTTVKTEARELVAALDRLDSLEQTEVITIPAAESGDSESASESTSTSESESTSS